MSDDERLNRRSVLKLAGGTAATAGAFGVGSTAAAEIDFGQVERLQAAVGGSRRVTRRP